MSSLVTLACSTLGAAEDSKVRISTYFGTPFIDHNGILNGDDAWDKHISAHKDRCLQILTNLGSGRARQGGGLTDLGSRCGAADVMCSWAFLTYIHAKPKLNKEIYKTGQSILGELLQHVGEMDRSAGKSLHCMFGLFAAQRYTFQPCHACPLVAEGE